MKKHVLVLALSLGLFSACGATLVPYTPQPMAVAQPADKLESLIVANPMTDASNSPCISRVSKTPGVFVVESVCGAGMKTNRVRFETVQSIELRGGPSLYAVIVMHTGGDAFVWYTDSLKDAQRMADCVAALSTKKPAAAPAAM